MREVSPESGMSVAFCPMHRRRIVIYLPTCQPEDPGSRDASVQVGVTCEDKATQWEEREEADPSLDKPSGANGKGPTARKGAEQETLATSCPLGPTSSRHAIKHLLQWVRQLPHHGIGEEACQESVGEGAVERPLGWDTPEEVCPLLSQSRGETLQCRANELQQRDQGGEEEAPRDSWRRAAEGDADEASASGSPQDFWPARGEKHPVPLEVVVTVVDSLYSLESVEQRAGSPPNPGPGSPGEGGSLAHDSCHLTEDEDLPRDSPVSTGYYPCFRTSSHLPPDQPGEREVPPEDPGKADASTQAGGARHDKASQWEADPSGEEARTKPRPGKRSPLPSPEQALEGESKVRVSPLEPKRQVLGGPNGEESWTANNLGDQLPTGLDILLPGRHPPAAEGPPGILLVSTFQTGKQPSPSEGEEARECCSVENVAQEAPGPCAPPPLRGPSMTPEAVYCYCS
ncbi:UNVERIFIED_CONTAM: hypothetical protein K2H54_001476 [Gekko kuhli]